MLDFPNQTLDQVPLTVAPFIVLAQHLCPLMRWNDRLNAAFQQIFDEMGCRVASVRDQSLKVKALQQLLSLSDVVALTCGEAEAQRIAQALYRDMDFAGEATSAASEGLLAMFFWAPAAHGWARIMVLSSMPCSMSGSSAK